MSTLTVIVSPGDRILLRDRPWRVCKVTPRSVSAKAIAHASDSDEIWPSIWLANRAVAEAYGLGPDDFEYILSTFPVFARKRPEFYAYLRERVQEWKRETDGVDVRVIPKVAEPRAEYGAARDADSRGHLNGPSSEKG